MQISVQILLGYYLKASNNNNLDKHFQTEHSLSQASHINFKMMSCNTEHKSGNHWEAQGNNCIFNVITNKREVFFHTLDPSW